MTKLRIAAIPDSRPVKLTVEFPAEIYRDLTLYAELLSSEAVNSREGASDPARLVPLMVGRFMETDRAFQKQRRVRLLLSVQKTRNAGSSQ
ncbi:DUF2274 domain-containing protein [Acetobacter conturbans]|uniref:DUF2274 domain-containing protein n=1 Tax=Acetobacter conturbans TaxID=1737472 RepID=A0ABX0K527_9PROT|nr:DUF2274 domain-containing protein [Acetobacter conturbans]NHN89448.1 DUF2274 domain-containing protein [Acetobacter conturbans]